LLAMMNGGESPSSFALSVRDITVLLSDLRRATLGKSSLWSYETLVILALQQFLPWTIDVQTVVFWCSNAAWQFPTPDVSPAVWQGLMLA
jgi:hypothetical protein